MERHKWNPIDSTPINIPGVYKADICVKCGCVKLHKYLRPLFSSSYLLHGEEFLKLPECKLRKL